MIHTGHTRVPKTFTLGQLRSKSRAVPPNAYIWETARGVARRRRSETWYTKVPSLRDGSSYNDGRSGGNNDDVCATSGVEVFGATGIPTLKVSHGTRRTGIGGISLAQVVAGEDHE